MSKTRKRQLRYQIANKIKLLKTRYLRFITHFESKIRQLSIMLSVFTCVCAFVVLVVLIVLIGYDHTTAARHTIDTILHAAQSIIILTIVFNLIFNFRFTLKTTRIFKWIVDIGMLITLLPVIYPHPEHPWIPWLEKILYSHSFFYITIGAYSLVDCCNGFMRIMSRKMNPSLMLGTTFLIFIIAGSLVLMMPRCLLHPISYTDAFFVSTSAVSITGLTSLDLPSTFTPLGQIVICILLQLGGIGIITFTSFFALFYSGSQSIYSQLLVKDIVYSKSMSALVPTLVTILLFTLSIELLGAIAVYLTLPECPDMNQSERILVCVFHATSSFCNAGFSIIPDGMANETLMSGNQSIYIVTSVLILAGAIGFPILANLRDIVTDSFRRINDNLHQRGNRLHRVHLCDLNTKIVVCTTFTILITSSLLFFIIESSHSMSGMSLYERTVQSVFNSLTPRSAGFISIPVADFMPLTLFIVMIQMWIGGASQSMAGGIKVNTLGVLLLNLRSIVTGRKGVNAFNRNIAIHSVRRANAVITLSILFTIIISCTLMALEPAMRPTEVIFESVSAVFTTGSSFGITPQLSTTSKYVLCFAMFVGRVGLVSLLTGFLAHGIDRSSHYPSENVVIN